MKETIKTLFGAIAHEYDPQRKKLIPCFDDFYGFQLLAATDSPRHQTILDVGAGTGLLSSMLCQVFPQSEFTLIDLAPEMIRQAQNRFNGATNFQFIVDDYVNHVFTGKFDLVVSALSIHHLADAEKQLFFKKVFGLLNSGGMFINGDQFISRSAATEARIQRKWIEGIEKSDLSRAEKDAAFERMKMDKPATAENNIKWLEEAGFVDVELLYKYGPFGVVCGTKP